MHESCEGEKEHIGNSLSSPASQLRKSIYEKNVIIKDRRTERPTADEMKQMSKSLAILAP